MVERKGNTRHELSMCARVSPVCACARVTMSVLAPPMTCVWRDARLPYEPSPAPSTAVRHTALRSRGHVHEHHRRLSRQLQYAAHQALHVQHYGVAVQRVGGVVAVVHCNSRGGQGRRAAGSGHLGPWTRRHRRHRPTVSTNLHDAEDATSRGTGSPHGAPARPVARPQAAHPPVNSTNTSSTSGSTLCSRHRLTGWRQGAVRGGRYGWR